MLILLGSWVEKRQLNAMWMNASFGEEGAGGGGGGRDTDTRDCARTDIHPVILGSSARSRGALR